MERAFAALSDVTRRGVLEHLHDVWREQRDEIRKQNGAFLESLAKLDAVQPHAARLDDAPLIAGRLALERDFDTKYGGFGSAPKFPHPTSLELCLHRWAHSRHDGAEEGASGIVAGGGAVTGRRVQVLAEGPRDAGRHEVVWDGRDGRGRAVEPGVYRVEVYLRSRSPLSPRVPWILSNPVYVRKKG